MMEFGDIFLYHNKQYVYLAMIDQVLFAALIISPAQAKTVIQAREFAATYQGEAAIRHKPAYCFVELQSTGYEEHIAHLGRTDEDKNAEQCLHGEGDKLDLQDMIELQKEILEGNIPTVLKEHIATIEL